MNRGGTLSPTKVAKEGWPCHSQFQSVKPLVGFLTLPTTGFVNLNFPPISLKAGPVLHIKNYVISSRIACLC
jgi:hypothetical protein